MSTDLEIEFQNAQTVTNSHAAKCATVSPLAASSYDLLHPSCFDRGEWWKRSFSVLNESGTAMPTYRNIYAFAIPNAEALVMLAKLSPVVEIGAGNGFWAACAKEAGAEIFPYDDMSWPIAQGEKYCEVFDGGPESVMKHPDATLFLCWPPYCTDMAAKCVEHFLAGNGKTLVHVGENGGCTGDDQFFKLLDTHFEKIARIDIPRWGGINDRMYVYERQRKE